MNKVAPVIIGDLLVSDSVKPDQFIIPALTEDVLQYLSKDAEIHPVELFQKIYILKNNVCIAFAGKLFYIKQFLEDISIFCRANDIIDSKKMNEFLEQCQRDDSWKHFSFVILVVEREPDHFGVGRFMHGEWMATESEIFGEVFAAGSGSLDFLIETKQNVKLRTSYPPEDISHVLQVNIIMLCKLLATERLTLASVNKHWGAGFEMIYFDGKQFTKLDSITYVINQGIFNDSGDIPEVPVPGVILHYRYHGELLTITVIRTHKGSTQSTDTSYIIECTEFAMMQFVVVPIGYAGTFGSDGFLNDPSFASKRTAMGYIIETENGHYLPASFNIGDELEVKYEHPHKVTITMMKEINDILVSEAKAVFPNFK